MITILTASVSAACVTLGLIHLGIWLRDRSTYANLGVAILAAGVAWFTWVCLALMHAATPAAFTATVRWMQVAGFVMVLGIVLYIRSQFRTARPWLGHLAWSVRMVMAGLSFILPGGANYVSVSTMRPVAFFGETVFVADSVMSAWTWVGQIGSALLLWFIADASWQLWRHGDHVERRRVLVAGIPVFLFVLFAATQAILVFSGTLRWPHIEYVAFLGVLCAISYELGSGVLRAASLSRQLQTSEEARREGERRMSMAADAARLGMWIWDLRTGETWLSEKCREVFAFHAEREVGFESFLERVHPDERSAYDAAVRHAIERATPYRTEYRVVLPDGVVRWIAAHGRVESDADGQAVRMLGVCIDITDQRTVELEARELSGRLITAQEEERRRIARDLHDDLNQRLALLSVEMELLDRGPRNAGRYQRAGKVAARIRELSSDVHRLAYELHPAKLDQLGLETASRSWCRDVAVHSGIRVSFVSREVPADVRPDIALCLFRIVQEALRNVVRHSRASEAHVQLTGGQGVMRLAVTDAGCGFDAAAASSKSGLGLISMRERVRLLRGTIDIESQPGTGTVISVSVPLPPAGA